MQIGDLATAIPSPLPEELVDVLIDNPNVRIERIVSRGHASPDDFWYDQTENEWVVLLTGEAILELENVADAIHLKAGMYINLPAHLKHRVAWTAPDVTTIWIAVFY
ncbi:cupin domain-containing protein [Spirosoma daeguense]